MQKVGKSLEIIDPKCAGDQVAPNMRDLSSPTHIRHYAYELTVGLPEAHPSNKALMTRPAVPAVHALMFPQNFSNNVSIPSFEELPIILNNASFQMMKPDANTLVRQHIVRGKISRIVI